MGDSFTDLRSLWWRLWLQVWVSTKGKRNRRHTASGELTFWFWDRNRKRRHTGSGPGETSKFWDKLWLLVSPPFKRLLKKYPPSFRGNLPIISQHSDLRRRLLESAEGGSCSNLIEEIESCTQIGSQSTKPGCKNT